MLKLNLGCGAQRIEGYVGVDLDESADIVADIRNLPFDDNCVDEALAIHVIEHFYKWEVQPLLREWLRVLKPGADLYIECPDLKKCCTAFLEGRLEHSHGIYGIYGNPHHQNVLMCHKWGYTPETLAGELMLAGFTRIGSAPIQSVKNAKRDMRLVASKPETAHGDE